MIHLLYYDTGASVKLNFNPVGGTRGNKFRRRRIVCTGAGVKTLRTKDTSDLRHFGTGAEVSVTHFGTGAEVSGHFGIGADMSVRHFGMSLV